MIEMLDSPERSVEGWKTSDVAGDVYVGRGGR
jgi:hypothetical protein